MTTVLRTNLEKGHYEVLNTIKAISIGKFSEIESSLNMDSNEDSLRTDLSKVKTEVEASKTTELNSNAVMRGFRLNWMNLRDADTGEILWQINKHLSVRDDDEHIARVPASILECSSVSRELNFSSHEAINNFWLKQRVLLHGKCVEEWEFRFGFVIPESTNTWQTLMESKPSRMKSAEILSGNIVVVTTFHDGNEIIGTCKLRIFYV